MKPTKSLFADLANDALIEKDREERQLALEYIAEAWNTAEDDGVEANALAHASLFAALTTMVHAYGEEAAADLIASLPDRIRSGEYNLTRSLQ
jgi:hypothetical protein